MSVLDESLFIIAEMSGNHNSNIDTALKIIEKAKEAGAHAVKLQTYTADTITINSNRPEFIVKGGLWDGWNLYELYKKAHTPWEWHPILFQKAKELEIRIFSTPFDESAVDFLEDLGAPLYKIASFEMCHFPLLQYVAKTKKPIIMSTGMASIEEIKESVNHLLEYGCEDLTLLHCVSEYPAPVSSCNLKTISDLQKLFPSIRIGLSDHTIGLTVPITAIGLGATVIEKHFTLSRSEGGVDSAFSLEPEELKTLCIEANKAYQALGQVNYKRGREEQKNKIFRRSIYVTNRIQKGELFTKDNIRVVRPGLGMEPKYYVEILGKRAVCDIDFATPLSLDFVEK